MSYVNFRFRLVRITDGKRTIICESDNFDAFVSICEEIGFLAMLAKSLDNYVVHYTYINGEGSNVNGDSTNL